MEVAKVKTQLKVDAFRSTQPELLQIHTPQIKPIDEGSPMQTNDGIPALELVLPKFCDSYAHHYTRRAPAKSKGKAIKLKEIIQMKSFDKNDDWSQEQMDMAVQECHFFHAMKYFPNQLKGISPYFHEGELYEFHFVPYVIYALPSSNKDQLELPLSPHGRLYKEFPSLHPSDMAIQA